VEQGNKFNQFDWNVEVNTHPANAAARTQDVPVYLCPSDPSRGRYLVPVSDRQEPAGRSNYLANLGGSGWVHNTSGPFHFNSKVTLNSIPDGTSNTALFAEVKRGPAPGHDDSLVSTRVPFSVWGPVSDPANANNLQPPGAAEDRSLPAMAYTGLVYYRGAPGTGFYTHTVPPNNKGRDCIRDVAFDSGHYSARSWHPGGVNVLFGDGSVRSVNNGIDPATWRAIGTRNGGEVIPADF
jgi:prepilin-type processing-associated H-X9-DG protein